MQDLTNRQRQMLEFIGSHISSHGYPPTVREIGGHMYIRSTNGVIEHLNALERKGKLRRDSAKSRGIVLLDAPARTEAPSTSPLESKLRMILRDYTIIATQGSRVVVDLAGELAAALAHSHS